MGNYLHSKSIGLVFTSLILLVNLSSCFSLNGSTIDSAFLVSSAPIAISSSTTILYQNGIAQRVILNYSNVNGLPANSCKITSVVHVAVAGPCSCDRSACSISVNPEAGYLGSASLSFTVAIDSFISNVALAGLTILPVPVITGALDYAGLPTSSRTQTISFNQILVSEPVNRIELCVSADTNANGALDSYELCNTQSWLDVTSTLSALGTQRGSTWSSYTLQNGVNGASFMLNPSCSSQNRYFVSLRVTNFSGVTAVVSTSGWSFWNPSCLGNAVALWLDGNDMPTVNLAYNSSGATATGAASGASVVVSSVDISAATPVGSLLQLGADTVNTYTVTSISGTSITVKPSLAMSYVGNSINRAGVSQWNDKSGNSNHMSQSTPANQPLWNASQKTLTFDGTNSVLSNTVYDIGTGAINIFAVAKNGTQTAGGSGNRPIVAGYVTSPGGPSLGTGSGGATFALINYWGGSSNSTAAGTFAIGQESILNGFFSSSSSSVAIDGGTPGANISSFTYNTTPGVSVGGDIAAPTRRFAGNIYEVLVVGGGLSTTNQQLLEGYLAWKWGTVNKLPSLHPYASSGGLFGVKWSPTAFGSNLTLWLDGLDASTLSLNFQTTGVNGSGAVHSNTIISSSALGAALPVGSIIQLGADTANPYTVTSVSGTAVGVIPPLASTYAAQLIQQAKVGQWNDKSGFGKNVAQPTLANQPTYAQANGKPALYFNGSSTSLTTTNVPLVAGATNFTFGAVFASFSGAGQRIMEQNAASVIANQAAGMTLIPNFNFSGEGNDINYSTLPSAVTGSTSLGMIVVSTPGSTASINGISQTSASAPTASLAIGNANFNVGRKIGNAEWFNGTANEILVFSNALSTTNRQSLEGYLAWKWGTQSSLPVGHPYFSAPP